MIPDNMINISLVGEGKVQRLIDMLEDDDDCTMFIIMQTIHRNLRNRVSGFKESSG